MTRMSNNDASGTKAKIFYILFTQETKTKIEQKVTTSLENAKT